jgi:dipeptidyl aminopeptidase/acylaminoacyl peptidase
MVAGVVAALAASQIVFAANNAPSTYGEIYVVSASGAVKNVTHDPAADVVPAVSPDGRRIAFARERASSVQIYVVGTDGRGLHAVSPRLAGGGLHDGGVNSIAWSPDGRRLAVVLTSSKGGLYLGALGGAWKRVSAQAQFAPRWSPDGTRLAFATNAGLVRVVSPTGRRLWDASGDGTPAWSQHDRLAVHQNSETVGIYDAGGRQRATIDGDAFAWSGDRLATLNNGLLALRPTGIGSPSFSVRVYPKSLGPSGGLVWAGADVVRFAGRDGWRGYDFAHRRMLASTGSFVSVFSAGGVTASVVYKGSVTLVRGGRTIRALPICNDEESASGLQFVGRTTALVYASGCPEPNGDIYSVAPDGTALRRLTHTGHDDFSPALSPDGVHVAYSEQETASFCKGCPHDLWATPGTHLTKHDGTEDAPFDDDPSFSPDGTQIAFDRSGPDAPPSLFTIPAGGGAAKSLGVVSAYHPAWGPHGVAFVKGYRPATIGLVDPVTRAVTTLGVEPRLDVQALAWSGDRLAYLSPGRITIVGGRTIHLPQQLVTGLAWSPDGTRFAYVAPDANGWGEVWTIGADGTGVRQVTRNLGVVGNLSWR